MRRVLADVPSAPVPGEVVILSQIGLAFENRRAVTPRVSNSSPETNFPLQDGSSAPKVAARRSEGIQIRWRDAPLKQPSRPLSWLCRF